MPAEASFYYGEDVLMVDHTPAGAIAAGEVVQVGVNVGIAHRAIPAGVLGSLGWDGGVYKSIGNAVIAVGTKVFWDNATNKVTAAVIAGWFLGEVTFPCAGDGLEVRFTHHQSAP